MQNNVKKIKYYLLLDISTLTTLIQLMESVGVVQYFIAVVGEQVFYRRINFMIPLNYEELDNCCTNQYKPN